MRGPRRAPSRGDAVRSRPLRASRTRRYRDTRKQGRYRKHRFIVGKRCVAVIDTGGTAEEGRELRAAIRAVTPLPVCYVINTHMHPDHIFGNAAFKGDHPQFVGSAALAQAEASRADNYMRALIRELGSAAAG